MAPRLALLCASLLAVSSNGFSPLFSRMPCPRTHAPALTQEMHKGVCRAGAVSRLSQSLLRLSAASITLDPSDAPLGKGFGPKLPERIPLGQRIKVGKYVVTPAGILMLVSVFGWAAVFFWPLLFGHIICRVVDGKRLRMMDWIIHWWSRVTMMCVGYKPKVLGLENLPPADEAVIYVPNHTSYLDILTLSGFVPRPFKYISKIEILRIPIIGWSMRLANHIAIRRASIESQKKMVEDAMKQLSNGVSLVTFAEGTRSKDGRLQTFKKGAFRISKAVGVRIVPVSISHLHKWMPTDAALPLGIPSDVVVRIHPPVDTKDRNENVVMREVFDIVNQGLPEYQQYPTSTDSTSQ